MGYLISLHDNEVDWNLLGIKVIGAIDALPIPAGNYEYGDAYMVGTETPYDMYIYTRPDGEVHTEGYWFPIGKFPAPGPQGPKGDGIEQIAHEDSNTVKSVAYDSTSGATIDYAGKTLTYTDSTTGEIKTQTYPAQLSLPIKPGKYIGIDTNYDNNALEVKVDDTALARDYVKLDKTKSGVIPQLKNGRVIWQPSSISPIANSIPQRNASGDCNFRKVNFEFIGFKDGNNQSAMYYYDIYNNTLGSDYFINKTSTNTGTLTTEQLTVLRNEKQSKNLRIVYDNQVYYRMNTQHPSDGTLNYIHLDSIEDGNGGYKATGKCFSVNVSTREWKVFDLDFGGKVYQHAIHFELTGAGTTGNANVWDIELVISSSSPNQITKNTLYKYISTSNYPLQGGTPISVYRERVEGPQGMGIGRMAVQHEVGEISNTDHYIFELMSMDGISETITNRDQNSLSSFFDTVTEVS